MVSVGHWLEGMGVWVSFCTRCNAEGMGVWVVGQAWGYGSWVRAGAVGGKCGVWGEQDLRIQCKKNVRRVAERLSIQIAGAFPSPPPFIKFL